MSSRRRHYAAEQKAEALRLVCEAGYTPAMVSRQLAIPLSNISRWVLAAQRAQQPDPCERRRELLNKGRERFGNRNEN